MRRTVHCVLAALLLLFAGCGYQYRVDSTTIVSTLRTEDLVSHCNFELTLAEQVPVQRGVLVIYERGDSVALFASPQLRRMAQDLHYSMVFAKECDASSYDDFQSDATKGPGRVLFQALTQFAAQTGHPELGTARVLLYGFSAAGVLSVEMASYAPSRIVGVIGYASGSAYHDLSAFEPSDGALAIPALIIANAKDSQSGTKRSLQYFNVGRSAGAPWAYGVQLSQGHCCTSTTIPIIMPWIEAVVARYGTPSQATATGVPGFFVCSPDGTIDDQNDEDCSFTSAGLGTRTGSQAMSTWLPDSNSAAEWLTWVTNTSGN